MDLIPLQAVIIFSAHGVANAVVQRARERGRRIIGATCPLVSKVHRQAQRYRSGGSEIIIIGHGGHPEVKGTRGRAGACDLNPGGSRRLASSGSTDPSVNDICYATQNRQHAVRELATQVEALLVVGAHNSSNSNRLREVGEQVGLRSYLVQNEDELDPAWFPACTRVGVTAGASAPEILVQRVLDRLRALGAESVAQINGVKESMRFRLPWMLD